MDSPNILRFSGGDPTCWILNVQEYFDYVMCPDVDRLYFVGTMFDHPASEWFYAYRCDNPYCSWQEFLDAVFQKFHRVEPQKHSTKSDLEPELSTVSDLEPHAELSTVTVSDMEPSVELPTDSDLELPIELSIESHLELTTPNYVSVVEVQTVDIQANTQVNGDIYALQPAFSLSIPDKKTEHIDAHPVPVKKNYSFDDYFIGATICFSDFHLEDKVYFNRGGVDTDIYSTSSNFLHKSRISYLLFRISYLLFSSIFFMVRI